MIRLKWIAKITTALVVIFGFMACDDDYNTVGSNVIGDNNFDILVNDEAHIEANSYAINSVQTNGLTNNLLGVYTDPVYGQRTASVLTQLSLAYNAPYFGESPVLDSVVLIIPYHHTAISQNGEETVYRLDSLFGGSPYKLSIKESNYFLNEFDPSTNFEQPQRYYSDQQSVIESNLTSNTLYEGEFLPSADEVLTVQGEGDDEEIQRYPPRLRIVWKEEDETELAFFTEKILNRQGTSALLNNNNFRNFFRGLYFKAEPLSGSDGNMLLLNFAHDEAGIRMYFTHQVPDTESDDPNATVDAQGNFLMGFNGTRVNVFNNSFAVPNDNNMYIAGGAGAVTVLDVFTQEQLEEFRANNWLINEANLTFFVNQDVVSGGNKEPERIFIYDIENNVPLLDYYLDASTTAAVPKANHLGTLRRDESNNGISYKIRLTEHINNIINNDSTNVRLGVVVSQNVNLPANKRLRNLPEVEMVPETSVISPEGTVLYGPDAAVEEKRLKLRIHYTEY